MTGLSQYLVICPLVLVAGIVDAIAGGGGLITLPAYMIAGLPPHNAIATNKMSSTLGTATATLRYARNGYIPWRLAAFCAVFAIAGSGLGAGISLRISDDILKVVMLVLLPVTAVFVLRGKTFSEFREPLKPASEAWIALTVAFFLGMYDGFYGPGTGTFLILLLTALARMPLTTANGVTKVINLSSNAAALAVYLIDGKVIFPLGLVAAVFSIAGNYIGARLFSDKGAKIAKPVMIAVLAVFLIKVISEMLQ